MMLQTANQPHARPVSVVFHPNVTVKEVWPDGKRWFFEGVAETEGSFKRTAKSLLSEPAMLALRNAKVLVNAQRRRRGAFYFQVLLGEDTKTANMYFFAEDAKEEDPGIDLEFHERIRGGEQFQHVWRPLLDQVKPELDDQFVLIVRVFATDKCAVPVGAAALGQVLTLRKIRKDVKRARRLRATPSPLPVKLKSLLPPVEAKAEWPSDFAARNARYERIRQTEGADEAYICGFCWRTSKDRLKRRMFQFLRRTHASTNSAGGGGGAGTLDRKRFKQYRLHRSCTRCKAPRGRLISVTVGLFNPDDLRKMTVCEVKEKRLFINKTEPCPGGLNDLRMGPPDREYRCATCSGDLNTCEGHPGRIELARRVYHVSYLTKKNDTILRVLQCVCHSCSRFLLPADHPSSAKIMAIKDPLKRLIAFAKRCQQFDSCLACGAAQRVYDRQRLAIQCYLRTAKPAATSRKAKQRDEEVAGVDNPDHDDDDDDADNAATAAAAVEGKQQSASSSGSSSTSSLLHRRGKQLPFTPEDAFRIFKYIAEEDLEKLAFREGVTRPEFMLLPVLYVPPPCARLATLSSTAGHARGENDITLHLSRILTYNNRLREKQTKLDQVVAQLVLLDAASSSSSSSSLLGQDEPTSGKRAASGAPGAVPADVWTRLSATEALALTAATQHATAAGVAGGRNGEIDDARDVQSDEDEDEDGDDDDADDDEDDQGRGNAGAAASKRAFLVRRRKRLEAGVRTAWDKLQTAVGLYMHSDACKGKSLAGYTRNPMKSVVQRFDKKNGRFRGNLNTKRCNFCARSVIGPDTTHDITQLGVPRLIAMRLPYPERVNRFNLHRLQKMVYRGPDLPNGALQIRHQDGRVTDLRYARNARKRLRLGDTVMRHLMDGDVVFFNRQPSLHRMSMMAFIVYLHDAAIFRLPVMCTPPYGADFDGDEMNLFLPQDEEARAEAYALLLADQHLTDPQGKACMGLVQDAQVAAFLLTDKDVFLTREQIMQAASQLHYGGGDDPDEDEKVRSSKIMRLPVPAVQVRNPRTGQWLPLWTGKQCASLPLPRRYEFPLRLQDERLRTRLEQLSEDLRDEEMAAAHGVVVGLEAKTEIARLTSEISKAETELNKEMRRVLDDEAVCMSGGELLTGRWDKSVVGPVGGGLVQTMVHDCGNQRTGQVLSDMQRMLNHWIAELGFGVGMSDCLSSASEQAKIQAILGSARNYLMHDPDLSSKIAPSVLEQHTVEVLAEARDQAGLVVLNSSGNAHNRMSLLIASGAKGDKIHRTQAAVSEGQISVADDRLPLAYSGGTRSFPHFPRGSRDPEARGFISESLVDGRTGIGQYADAAGGREGIVKTALVSARVGYTNRRLVRCLEGVQVEYDGTVRDDNGAILCLAYGGDGFDTQRIETQHYPGLWLSLEQLQAAYDGTRRRSLQEDSADPGLLRQEFEAIVADVRVLRAMKLLATQHREMDTEFKCPVHFARLLRAAQAASAREADGKAAHRGMPLTASEVVLRVRKLQQECVKQVLCPESITVFLALLRLHFCAVNIIDVYQLTRGAFETLMDTVLHRFCKARAQAGEQVGLVAGQSIGEPSQQMTLKSKTHGSAAAASAGGGGSGGGGARVRDLDDLIRVSRKPKPGAFGMDIYLLPSASGPAGGGGGESLARSLKPLPVGRFVRESGVFFEPDASGSHASLPTAWERQLMLDCVGMLTPRELQQLSSFVLRFDLDKPRLLLHGKTVEDVFWALQMHLLPGLHHVWARSPVNSRRWVILVRLKLTSVEVRNHLKAVRTQRKGRRPKNTTATSTAAVSSAAATSEMAPLSEREMVEQFRLLALALPCHGVPGIVSAYCVPADESAPGKKIEWDPETLAVRRVKEDVIETVGSNLRHVLNLPEVDAARTISSNALEVAAVLGIEAATKVLHMQIVRLFKHGGVYVNPHHVHTAATQMAQTGELLGLTRTGYQRNREMASLFKRLSFETIVRVLMEAGQLGEVDTLQSATSSITVGNAPRIGTNVFAVYRADQQQEETEARKNVVSQNAHTVSRRMMEPLETADLVAFIPTLAERREFRAFMENLPRSTTGSGYTQYRAGITAKNCIRVVPDYSRLYPPTPDEQAAAAERTRLEEQQARQQQRQNLLFMSSFTSAAAGGSASVKTNGRRKQAAVVAIAPANTNGPSSVLSDDDGHEEDKQEGPPSHKQQTAPQQVVRAAAAARTVSLILPSRYGRANGLDATTGQRREPDPAAETRVFQLPLPQRAVYKALQFRPSVQRRAAPCPAECDSSWMQAFSIASNAPVPVVPRLPLPLQGGYRFKALPLRAPRPCGAPPPYKRQRCA